MGGRGTGATQHAPTNVPPITKPRPPPTTTSISSSSSSFPDATTTTYTINTHTHTHTHTRQDTNGPVGEWRRARTQRAASASAASPGT
eukprot:3798543-Rhodomonas_salina.3